METKKLIIIVGRPGSGKTYLAKNKYPDYLLVDDPKSPEELWAALRASDKVVLCDPWLCFQRERNAFEGTLNNFGLFIDIQWIFFEDNLEKAKKLAVLRDKKENRSLPSKPENFKYELPFNQKTIKIYTQ